MGVKTAITTGEQSVTTTGAITGSLDTSALTGDYTVFLRVRGMTASTMNIQIALEDTANASAFSEALQPWVASFNGISTTEGIVKSVRSYDLPAARFGATNTKFRFNVQAVNGSPTCKVDGWLEQ